MFRKRPDASEGLDGPPRFCPRCGTTWGGGVGLCGHCGESTRPKGYCPVCEAHVALPSGALCRKHDVELESAPRRPESWPEDGGAPALVTLTRSSDPGRIEALRIRLEAEGIPTFLQGSRMGSASMYLVATGGPVLQVPEALADEARVILSQVWSHPVEGEDDAWEEMEPEPWTNRREVLNSVLALFLGFSLLIVLLIRLLDSP